MFSANDPASASLSFGRRASIFGAVNWSTVEAIKWKQSRGISTKLVISFPSKVKRWVIGSRGGICRADPSYILGSFFLSL